LNSGRNRKYVIRNIIVNKTAQRSEKTRAKSKKQEEHIVDEALKVIIVRNLSYCVIMSAFRKTLLNIYIICISAIAIILSLSLDTGLE